MKSAGVEHVLVRRYWYRSHQSLQDGYSPCQAMKDPDEIKCSKSPKISDFSDSIRSDREGELQRGNV